MILFLNCAIVITVSADIVIIAIHFIHHLGFNNNTICRFKNNEN